MIPGGSTSSCFPGSGSQGLSIYGVSESEDINQAVPSDTHSSSNPGNFLYNLSVLKDKVHQVESLATMFLSSDYSQHHQSPQSTPAIAIAIASMGTLIQEIIVTASSLMFTCQQVSLGDHSGIINSTINHDHQNHHPNPPAVHCGGRVISQFGEEREQGLYSKNDDLDWYGDHSSYNNHEVGRGDFSAQKDENNEGLPRSGDFLAQKGENNGGSLGKSSAKNYDIVELDAADLLAKYTHYCQVCGKGFKRDANLRMHMRAHGDEFKSSVALSNPLKNKVNNSSRDDTEASPKLPRKYSCPHEGCRWNKNHAKFQPLKSMICVKNHYKRSHCPKMYVCKRCNRKQFSVLSDLRTHEKHCGDLKWQCSCGTTFSRKDKLLGHVALFVGHTPAVSSLVKMGKAEHQNQGQMQLDR